MTITTFAKIEAEDVEIEEAPAFSEEALALKFAERHACDLRYIAAWGKWYGYDGKTWKPDETRNAFSLARNLCREAATEASMARSNAKPGNGAKQSRALRRELPSSAWQARTGGWRPPSTSGTPTRGCSARQTASSTFTPASIGLTKPKTT
jgi:putative DNA primase/helicase